MKFERYGRQWETLRGYDLVNEAAVVELRDITKSATGEVVICGIVPTTTGVLSVEQYRDDLPKDLVDWFRQEVGRVLAPDEQT